MIIKINTENPVANIIVLNNLWVILPNRENIAIAVKIIKRLYKSETNNASVNNCIEFNNLSLGSNLCIIELLFL